MFSVPSVVTCPEPDKAIVVLRAGQFRYPARANLAKLDAPVASRTNWLQGEYVVPGAATDQLMSLIVYAGTTVNALTAALADSRKIDIRLFNMALSFFTRDKNGYMTRSNT